MAQGRAEANSRPRARALRAPGTGPAALCAASPRFASRQPTALKTARWGPARRLTRPRTRNARALGLLLALPFRSEDAEVVEGR